MLKNITICNFEDLLEHAQKMGYGWNEAHDLLVKANIYLGHLTTDHYSDSAYCLAHEHTDARKILKNFMNKHQLEEFYITSKNYEIY